MSRSRALNLTALLCLLLSACGLLQNLPVSANPEPTPPGGQQVEPTVQEEILGILQATQTAMANPAPTNPEATQFAPPPRVIEPVVTTTPIPEYRASLPFVVVSAGGPGNEWLLEPHRTEAQVRDLNYTLDVVAPYLQPETNEATAGFNLAIQELLDGQYSEVQNALGGESMEGLGGWVQISYLVTSAPGWTFGAQPSVNFADPAALTSGQGMMRAGHDLVSILFETFSYLGGSQPGTAHTGFTYDFTTQEVLELNDLFLPESDYLSVISTFCIARLNERSEILIPAFEANAAPDPQNYQVWTLSHTGLLVTFEEYQVAPYEAGAQQVLVPYQELAALLNPEGPLGMLAQK